MNKTPLIKQGWLRALLFLLLGILVTSIFVFIGGLVSKNIFAKDATTLPQFIIVYLVNTIGFVVVVFAMRLVIDKQSIASLGFIWKGFKNEALSGFFIALLILSTGSLVLVALRYLHFTSIALNVYNLAWGILLFAIVAFAEEIIFRGYLLNNLLESFNKWIAITISSAVFALGHITNPNITILSVANIFIAGILLGINYIYTKNLWFGIFLHFAWNYFQGPILGFDVSGFETGGLLQQTISGPSTITGGAFGFEGSLICLAIEIGMIIFLVRFYEKKYKSNISNPFTD
jgi:uncharacterized protein